MNITNNHKSFSLFLILILATSTYAALSPSSVKAQNQPTLAETIHNVLSNINPYSYSSSWVALYSQIFGLCNQSTFDEAAQQSLNLKDYPSVIFIARLAELNNYTSQTLNNCVISALKQIPMVGSLPATGLSSNGQKVFSVYDRYMVNAYRYAQELGVPGWNITQAYLDLANAYLHPPAKSTSGEMLWINPAAGYSSSYTSRYYDEYAETLAMFLEFASSGVKTDLVYNGQVLNPNNFMDDVWVGTQNLWDNQYYGYSLTAGSKAVECEMGNFAQIIAMYQNTRGNVSYFDRVIQDLEYTLLAENFSSPIWGGTGFLQHSVENNQSRLEETTGALISLQMLYPYFDGAMQSNFRGMLENGMWQGLINSSLFSGNQFRFVNNFSDAQEEGYSDEASSLGAMALFLDGIVPGTGYLAFNAINEAYQDYRTCFPTSQWQFNYQNNSIRIPVFAGNLSFVFGSQEVTQNFPTSGVYQVQFAGDWNSVSSISKIVDVNSASLPPATLQPITRPAPTPSPTPTPIVSPTPTAKPTAPPTQFPTLTTTLPTATPTTEPQLKPETFSINLVAPVLGAAIFSATLALIVVYLRRGRR
jgi:hypothetical protein